MSEASKQLIQSERQRDNLKVWDTQKLTEIVNFSKNSEGYPVDVKLLRQRLEAYGQHLLNDCCATSQPWTYGKGKLYYANMPAQARHQFYANEGVRRDDQLMTDCIMESE